MSGDDTKDPNSKLVITNCMTAANETRCLVGVTVIR